MKKTDAKNDARINICAEQSTRISELCQKIGISHKELIEGWISTEETKLKINDLPPEDCAFLSQKYRSYEADISLTYSYIMSQSTIFSSINENYNAQIQDLKKSLESLASNETDLKQRIKDLGAENDSIKDANAQLDAEISRLKEDNANLIKILARVNDSTDSKSTPQDSNEIIISATDDDA